MLLSGDAIILKPGPGWQEKLCDDSFVVKQSFGSFPLNPLLKMRIFFSRRVATCFRHGGQFHLDKPAIKVHYGKVDPEGGRQINQLQRRTLNSIAAITRRYAGIGLLTAGVSLLMAGGARAAITFTVSFSNDDGGQYADYYSSITSNLVAAAQTWAQYFPPTDTTIAIEVQFTDDTTASCSSETSYYVDTVDETNIFEQAATTKVRTGFDQNGDDTPDIVMQLGTNYLVQDLWFDPDPLARVDSVPDDKNDAMSVFTHELCHAWAFTGWIDQFDGTFPGDYESTFDVWTRFDGANFYFTGPEAEAIYGGPVPLTYGNVFHVGNDSPRPGSDLIPDLMNGVVFHFGERYYISSLDLAMCADAGVPITNPPVTLTQSQWLNGTFAFNIACPFGRAMRVDFSTNLVNWTVLTNLISTNVAMAVQDTAAASSKSRFYRVALQ